MTRDDRSQDTVAVVGLFVALCTLLVALRVYSKVFLVKNFAVDDYCSVIALVCTTRREILGHLLMHFAGCTLGLRCRRPEGRRERWRQKTVSDSA